MQVLAVYRSFHVQTKESTPTVVSAGPAFGRERAALVLPIAGPALLREHIHRTKTGIMARRGVLLARVSQADDQIPIHVEPTFQRYFELA